MVSGKLASIGREKQDTYRIIEAEEKLDSGRIYLKDYIELDGTELLPEIKKKQGDKTIDLVLTFLNQWP
ncbi:hypothetical protein [Candidatus Kuenenia stuttgartiensis]|uniref:hypothetical protein n=1 Tax=Kuenenia stuttgartiensis TaxID=174633 RepID=UPI00146A8D38|nr:hypothetical protein [Candidatus Kuenenia stuttgartiensis]